METEPATFVEAEPSAPTITNVHLCLQSATLIHVLELLNVSQEDLVLIVFQMMTATTSQPAETEPAIFVEAAQFVIQLTTASTCLQSVQPILVLELQDVFKVDLEWIVIQTLIARLSQLVEMKPATYVEAEPSVQHILIVPTCQQGAILIHAMERLNVYLEVQEIPAYRMLTVSINQDVELAKPVAPAEPEKFVKQTLIAVTYLQSVILIHVLEPLNVSLEEPERLVLQTRSVKLRQPAETEPATYVEVEPSA